MINIGRELAWAPSSSAEEGGAVLPKPKDAGGPQPDLSPPSLVPAAHELTTSLSHPGAQSSSQRPPAPHFLPPLHLRLHRVEVHFGRSSSSKHLAGGTRGERDVGTLLKAINEVGDSEEGSAMDVEGAERGGARGKGGAEGVEEAYNGGRAGGGAELGGAGAESEGEEGREQAVSAGWRAGRNEDVVERRGYIDLDST